MVFHSREYLIGVSCHYHLVTDSFPPNKDDNLLHPTLLNNDLHVYWPLFCVPLWNVS